MCRVTEIYTVSAKKLTAMCYRVFYVFFEHRVDNYIVGQRF